MTKSKTIEIDAKTRPVKSVTLYKSGKADVVRAFSIDLEVGENTIEVSHLSNSLQKQSVRVSGVGGVARLSDIVTSIGDGGRPAFLPYLEKKSQHNLARQGVLVEELHILRSYAKSMERANVPYEEMFKFLEAFREKQMSTLDAILDFEGPIWETSRMLDAAKKSANVDKGGADSKVTIRIDADEACSITLRLRYVVHDATWKPVYDLYASTGDSKPVKVSYRAKVNQSTGEDWTDAELTLSTASALTNTIPKLPTYRIASQNLFGSTTTSQQQQPARTGFSAFGTPTSSTIVGGTFGQPASSGALFGGSTLSATSSSNSQNKPTGGLFRAPNETTGTSTGSGIFNSTQVATDTQTKPFGGLFSGSSASGGSTSASFGRPQTYNPTPTPPLFGGSFATAQKSGFGATTALQSHESLTTTTPATPAPQAFTTASAQPFGTANSVNTLSESTATIRTDSISESYLVQGTVKIPSDGEEHVVSITTFDVEADITRVAVPRLKADVYLQCKVKNVSSYRLLAGALRVFLDDSYVSTASIFDVGVNESFECTLGVDPSIGVSYERTSKTMTDEARKFGGFQSSVTTYTSRTTVKNKRSTAVKQLILKDALPLGDDDKDWRVILRKPKGLADATQDEEVDVRDGGQSKRKVRWTKLSDGKEGETEGKYEWVLDVPTGDEITLVAEWDVKTCKGELWSERAEPGFEAKTS